MKMERMLRWMLGVCGFSLEMLVLLESIDMGCGGWNGVFNIRFVIDILFLF